MEELERQAKTTIKILDNDDRHQIRVNRNNYNQETISETTVNTHKIDGNKVQLSTTNKFIHKSVNTNGQNALKIKKVIIQNVESVKT